MTLAKRRTLCDHRAMIKFTPLRDEEPALACSPLLRAARLTLGYTVNHGSIGLTATKAFKREFVHWAVEEFGWPGFGVEDAFRFNRVLNEHDFVPLQIVHFLLLKTRLGRHHKGRFCLTSKGKALATTPGGLFAELIPFFILQVDHASYGRLDERPLGSWDVWLNVLNLEMEDGANERQLFAALFGDGPDWDNDGWREMAAFCQCVLKPLDWAGLVSVPSVQLPEDAAQVYFKTPLWHAALKLETDGLVYPAVRH